MKWDAIIAATLCVVSALVGIQFVGTMRQTGRLGDVTGLEQQLYGAAVMSVCNRGRVTPVLPLAPAADTPPGHRPLIAFLAQRSDGVRCAEIPADVPTASLSGMQGAAPYLLDLVALPWRLAGPSWPAFDRLLGLLFAASIALAYLFVRLVGGRGAAGFAAVLFLLSPIHLGNLGNLRDYSKAPFFVATLVVVALLLLRAPSVRWTLALCAAGGVLAGVGFGVRTDIALNLVLVVLAGAVLRRGSIRETWRVRALSASVAILAFLAAAAPVLRSPSTSSNLWHWAILGYAHDFDGALGVAPAPYETGYFYDDSYVASIVDAYRGRVTGAADSVSVDMPAYTEASRSYYLRQLATFPADAWLRAEASLIRILGLPYVPGELPGDALPSIVRAAMRIRALIFTRLAWVAVPLFLLVVAAVGSRDVRLAMSIAIVVTLLGALPSVQFQTRHYFHLELLPLAMLGLLIAPRLAWTSIAPMKAFALVAVMLACAVVPLLALRVYQQRSAIGLLGTFESAAVTQVRLDPSPTGGAAVVLASAAQLLPADPGNRSMRSEQLVVETRDCAARTLPITFRYTTQGSAADYSRTIRVPQPSRLFFTVYETGAQSRPPHHFVFDRIEVPAAGAACVAAIGRFAAPDAFPLLIPAVLPPEWRRLPLHQTLVALESAPLAAVVHD